jgi:hypothetical protein
MTPAGCLSSIAALVFGLCSTALASPAAGTVPAEPPFEPGGQPLPDGVGERQHMLEHRVNVGIGPLLYLPPIGPTIFGWALEASYGVRHSGYSIEADVGLRGIAGESVAGAVALDFYGAIALAPELGRVWAPRIGLELGISTAARSILDREWAAPGSFVRAFSATPPGYLGTALSPARFRWRQWHIDAMALFIGSSVPGLGRTARVQVSFLRLGASF